jgi:hypothetical protein
LLLLPMLAMLAMLVETVMVKAMVMVDGDGDGHTANERSAL